MCLLKFVGEFSWFQSQLVGMRVVPDGIATTSWCAIL
jgi:hypothetical protein